jgi:hypothetical protein
MKKPSRRAIEQFLDNFGVPVLEAATRVDEENGYGRLLVALLKFEVMRVGMFAKARA